MIYFKNRYIKANINRLFSKINREKKLVYIIIFCLIGGAVLGSLFAGRLDTANKNELISSFDSIIDGIRSPNLVKKDAFIKGLIKYGLSSIALWSMPLITRSPLPSAAVLLYKGASLGFTTSILVGEYGLLGIGYAMILYFPQNLILTFLYFIIAYYSLNIILYLKKRPIAENINIPLLLFGIVLAFIVSLTEAYIVPTLANILFF